MSGTAADQRPQWPICNHDGCTGSRIPNTGWCLAHAVEQAPDAYDAELKRIGIEGTVDARGVSFSTELLGQLLAAAPRKDDRPAFTAAKFDSARFQGKVSLIEATFDDTADFGGATFDDMAEFGAATFKHAAKFKGATFKGWAHFGGTLFEGDANFDAATFTDLAFFDSDFENKASFNAAVFEGQAIIGGTTFKGMVDFARATFKDTADFVGATFEDMAHFGSAIFEDTAEFNQVSFKDTADFAWATFKGAAVFGDATFEANASFDTAAFKDEAGFGGAVFKRTADFCEARFEHAKQVGPLLARQLVLDDVTFGARVQLDVTAAAVCARRAQFPAGVLLRLRYASVFLDDANLAAPAILAAVWSAFPELAEQELEIVRAWQRLPPGPRQQRWQPRVLSLRRADVSGLRLANVDLRACRFAAAHNLDRLRIEGTPLFARTTGWWRTRRKTLAEEQHWRTNRPGRWRPAGWYPQACQPPASSRADTPRELQPGRLAALYRDLRKGREDAKDEPGAADFYYGECEMRRHDPSASRAERLVLWLYWLLSGYGLRAWRALAALVAVVLLAGVVLAFWGFPSGAPSFRPVAVNRGGGLVYEQQPADPPPGLGRLPEAIRFSARSATALLRGPDRALTPLGEWLEIGLRFAGPVLLGLAVLSVRGRVRR